MFKSVDAGKTWEFVGLGDSQHIARIVIHPTNPEIVYVAALGHLFSRNEERGVFRTRNGGKTWDKVLYVDDGTGAVDLVMNRQSPGTLYAAMYRNSGRRGSWCSGDQVAVCTAPMTAARRGGKWRVCRLATSGVSASI